MFTKEFFYFKYIIMGIDKSKLKIRKNYGVVANNEFLKSIIIKRELRNHVFLRRSVRIYATL